MILATITHTSQLWPTVERLLTAIATILVGGTFRYARGNHQINQRVEIAVNGNLTARIEQVAQIAAELKTVTAELATARSDLDRINSGSGSHLAAVPLPDGTV